MLKYAGIGSRKTPKHVLEEMMQIGAYLGERGALLRSGHARGADQAFEQGAKSVKGKREIMIPWNGFEGGFTNMKHFYIPQDSEALNAIAAHHHPAWDRLPPTVQLLHKRNGCQVLGLDLRSPVDMVVCWTPEASGSGGTGQALRIANTFDIPVFDLASEEQKEKLAAFVQRWEKGLQS